MSETIADHGYIPEEHAPDPVIGHGDPTPPGKIAIWMFLASEIMFFIGVLGTYIVLRSGSPHLFSKHAEILSKPLGGLNTLVLLGSSVTMYIAVEAAQKRDRAKTIFFLLATIACALGFMVIKYTEYRSKFTHHTIVARETKDGPLYVYDGHMLEEGKIEGFRADISQMTAFNINLVSEKDVREVAAKAAGKTSDKEIEEFPEAEFTIPKTAIISQDITYGPWKNIFFASYFATTGVHAAHVIGGIIALGMLLIHAIRGKVLPPHTEYIGLYWHFVDLVWIFLFPLLYLI